MIGDVKVPEGWRRVRLGEVAHSLKSGGTPLRDVLEFWGGDVPFVLIEDMTKTNKYLISTNETISEKGLKNSSAWIVPKDSILLSMYASLGKVVINKIDVATNQAILGIILKKDYNLEFMYYILGFNKRNYEKYTIQTTQKNLNKDLVSQIFISIPISFSEQRKIAEILETVDNAIERTDTIIEKYKRIKQGLMQDLLTRGVVENDELGVMNYELRDEKKHRFKDSPLGRIPEVWDVVELGEISFLKGRIGWHGLTTQEYLEYGKYYLITGVNFENGKVLWESCYYVDKKRYEMDKNIQLKIKDVLVTKDGTIGKVSYIDKLPKKATLGTGVFVLRPSNNTCYPRYLYYVLTSFIFNKFIENLRAGSTISHLYQEDFIFFNFPIPPPPEQHRIASILSQIDETIEKEQKYKQKLERIKHGVMDDLLTGKVRVNHLIKEGMENVQTA